MDEHLRWEMRMIRERGWIYWPPRKAALWRRVVRAITDWVTGDSASAGPPEPQEPVK